MFITLLLLLLNTAHVAQSISSKSSKSSKSNIVIILSDDQDLLLGSLNHMPSLQTFLVQNGTSFSNHFTTTPVCCPSRSTIITGRFPHNYKQINPSSITGCITPEVDNTTMFPQLHDAGYRVGLFGKHLNNGGMQTYCPKNKHSFGTMPKGIDKYLGMCPDTCYENCVYAKGEHYGGTTKWYQPTKHAGYHTAVIGNRTIQFIQDTVHAGHPFFVYVAPHAPHLPATPAPWYMDTPIHQGVLKTPRYNISSPNKHWMVSQQPPLTKQDEKELDGIFQNRTRTLLSVDDIVFAVVETCQQLNILNNTYIIYTSDHGFHLGDYRLGAFCVSSYYLFFGLYHEIY